MVNKMDSIPDIARMNGRTHWIHGSEVFRSIITNAIVEKDRIAFDVASDTAQYTVVLVPASPANPEWWRGHWKCKNYPDEGHCAVRLYEMAKVSFLRLALIGTWNEGGVENTWFVELS